MDLNPGPFHREIELILQLFDDAFADVAEGSDVIGKDLYADCHGIALPCVIILGTQKTRKLRFTGFCFNEDSGLLCRRLQALLDHRAHLLARGHFFTGMFLLHVFCHRLLVHYRLQVLDGLLPCSALNRHYIAAAAGHGVCHSVHLLFRLRLDLTLLREREEVKGEE
jgi:hypothetical protein